MTQKVITMSPKHIHIIKKVVLAVLFLLSIVMVTSIALRLGTIANATTVGFILLVIVVLSAVFAGLAVAVLCSVTATLLFNYFFFPPIGTFIIEDPANWVALFTFLFTSVVISRLTASAHENAQKAELLSVTQTRMNEFGKWLLSVKPDAVTLSSLAEAIVRIFVLDYCSIHVYSGGKWHHHTGSATGELASGIPEILQNTQDRPTQIVELAEESGFVRYSRIQTGQESTAVLAVKSEYLPAEAIENLGSMIGMKIESTNTIVS